MYPRVSISVWHADVMYSTAHRSPLSGCLDGHRLSVNERLRTRYPWLGCASWVRIRTETLMSSPHSSSSFLRAPQPITPVMFQNSIISRNWWTGNSEPEDGDRRSVHPISCILARRAGMDIIGTGDDGCSLVPRTRVARGGWCVRLKVCFW